MRKAPIILVFLSFFLASYYSSKLHERETAYEPIIMTQEQLRKSIGFGRARALINPGKIYLKDKYIYIVEKFEGIHVIDNSDRMNPKKTGFIQVPGCIDLAIKANYMYVDNAVDLVTIYIGNFSEIKETGRVVNVFPELVPPDTEYVPSRYSRGSRPEGTVIVAWIPKN